MHLLSASAGQILDGVEPVDLEQTPGDIVVLSAADTEIAALARACAASDPDAPSLRLASLNHLSHNFSVDLYISNTLSKARLIVLRLMGGASYWRYGLDELVALARGRDIKLAVIPGDHRPDPSLDGLSTLPDESCNRLWAYLVEGGPDNMNRFLGYCRHLLEGAPLPEPASPLPLAGIYSADGRPMDLDALRQDWTLGRPNAAIIFYRALHQAFDTAPVDALIAALEAEGLNALPIYISSLKDRVAAETVTRLFAESPPDIVINCTGFAVSRPDGDWSGAVLDSAGAPVLQTIFAGVNRQVWADSGRGLGARDIAMNIALPEIDGRILSRAVSFKSELRRDEAVEAGLVVHKPEPDRIDFTARLAAGWARLRRQPAKSRRIGIILSNYPASDGRIANGVGLDTPAGTVQLLKAMQAAGYRLDNPPETGAELMELLKSGPTNAGPGNKSATERLSLADYMAFLKTLPDEVRNDINSRWGEPQEDTLYDPAAGGFCVAAHRLGRIVVAVQPARGYAMDAKAIHHDPVLPPPHGYLAFYLWLRMSFAAHAIIHMGKHGNMEWLPGKALALSQACYPEIALGPLPHIYPFIANDPGEGTQAKRRSSAVIVSHLTPPLTRAESYGPLKDLEALVDEYYEASGVDPRRLKVLGRLILEKTYELNLDGDCGIAADDSEDEKLQRLDNYLCELKELQIRDGLHIFGQSPEGDQLDGLLSALARIPRAEGHGPDASLQRALAEDLGFKGFDPLDCDYAAPWQGPRPACLEALSTEPWRITGDTVERIELLSLALIRGRITAEPDWRNARQVLHGIETDMRPRIGACGPAEIRGVLTALDGNFLTPGPSGAPTRGRLDVLPTGRNFFSVDTRTVPTQTAWELGRLSADRLITAYFQEHGEWPRRMGLSAWGTSNMRTGGDDIAQALALIGAEPVWDNASRRVTGFQILTPTELKRPRVDIVFRISGFFRDAFPAQIDLLDSAVQAIAALDEPADMNPLKANGRQGRENAPRIFGSKPGAYGAGVQERIETGAWDKAQDLAEAYLQRAGYAYGGGAEGGEAGDMFRRLLAGTDAVVHNQDAREFDLLDSDDFYDFEGGMAAAARQLSGRNPAIYHNDHAIPDNPKIRRLEEEIALIVRGRAANPKWIAGQRRHGYKGAADMAQTLTNLFAFAATTGAVRNHHFEMLFEAYMIDETTRDFLRGCNPDALRDMAERFQEAVRRDLWQPRRNSAMDFLNEMTKDQ